MTGDGTAAILFVCTGNLCRSAVAERLTAAWLSAQPGSPALRVSSVGTGTVDGRPMHPASARALSALGGDPGDFFSRRLRDEHLDDVDLVLTATRGHRAEVLSRRPVLMRRTFTIREAAALVPLTAAPESCGTTPSERLRSLATLLDEARSRRAGGREDDVLDPIDQPAEVHAEVAGQIARALEPLLRFVTTAPATTPSRVSQW
jgi:protein-tyrosine-phosphatase